MKNNSFLIIRIIIRISIYIECALGGVLCDVLCSALCGALLGNCSTPPSTLKKNSILIFLIIKTVSAIHKKEGFMNYTKNNMSRWIGLNLPSLSGSSAHKGRNRNNEICKNRIVYGHVY
jgi:hypothetical protein